MSKLLKVDICIIGAGSGGLSVAAGAAQMGASVILVEKHKMGGDCLNYGCVPSKSLLAAAHVAEVMQNAEQFGIGAVKPQVNFKSVHDHIHRVIANIAPNDSIERFESMGVKVIQSVGQFANEKELIAGDVRIQARRFVIATGSTAAIPPISGLENINYLSNETLFNLVELPEHLIIIGGGPIGCEMAQAFSLLGAKVTLLVRKQILPKDDLELVAVVRNKLVADGVNILESTDVLSAANQNSSIAITIKKTGLQQVVTGSHCLLATGRAPDVKLLNLEKAGVRYSRSGIQVDARLRTSNKKIYAIGDVIGGYQFTHMANYHAGVVIKNILFRLPAKVNYQSVPWVTYTAAELAHVGLSEEQAKQKFKNIKILRWDFAENDRAQTSYDTEGKIKVICNKKGVILGTSIVGKHAGELIVPWGLAIANKLKINTIAEMIMPYPTLSEVSKRAAGSYFTPLLFSKKTKWIVKFLSLFG